MEGCTWGCSAGDAVLPQCMTAMHTCVGPNHALRDRLIRRQRRRAALIIGMHVGFRDRMRVASGEEALPPLPQSNAVHDHNHEGRRGDCEGRRGEPHGARAVELHIPRVVARTARFRLRHRQPESRGR